MLLAPEPGGAAAARAAAEDEEWRDLSQLGLTGRLPPAEPTGDQSADGSEQGRRQQASPGRQPRRHPHSGEWFCGALGEAGGVEGVETARGRREDGSNQE